MDLQHRELILSMAMVVGIAAMLAAAFGLVWWSGGTQTAVPHVLYFPVVISALVAGRWAGAITGLAAGLLLGPLMPLSVEAGTPQPLSGWLIRMGFFVAIGLLVGEGRHRLLELAESRQRFVSAISHEVRTPLAAILGFSQLLAERGYRFDPDERREFAELIHREVTELSDIVDGYIVAARMDDAALIVEPQDTDLFAIVESSLERLPEPVRQSRVQVSGQPVTCWADPMRVRQIVRTLLANALAYGGDAVQIAVGREGDEAVVAVTSDTPGVTEEVIARALDPLNPGRKEQTRPHPVGLGLSVASRLTELMAGRLTYRQRAGVTTLEARFPVKPQVNLRATRGLTSERR